MGLYVLESAESGGKLSLSSSFDLYNELALNHPGVLETLASPLDAVSKTTQSIHLFACRFCTELGLIESYSGSLGIL